MRLLLSLILSLSFTNAFAQTIECVPDLWLPQINKIKLSVNQTENSEKVTLEGILQIVENDQVKELSVLSTSNSGDVLSKNFTANFLLLSTLYFVGPSSIANSGLIWLNDQKGWLAIFNLLISLKCNWE